MSPPSILPSPSRSVGQSSQSPQVPRRVLKSAAVHVRLVAVEVTGQFVSSSTSSSMTSNQPFSTVW